MKEIYSFFNNLYSDHPQNDTNDSDTESFLKNLDISKLFDDHKQILVQPITKNELYNTLISMNRNKTPGLDGLPTEFYIVFGQILVIC